MNPGGWDEGLGDGGGDPVFLIALYGLGLLTAILWKIYHKDDQEIRWLSLPIWGFAWSMMWIMVFQIIALFVLPFIGIYNLAIRFF